jgi:hypothetical protein
LAVFHLSYSDDTPISLGIVLDTSGSMERKIATARSAVDRFIRTIYRDDDSNQRYAGNAIEKSLSQLAEELRSQYSLGFYPKHDMNYRKWHHVEIRARDPRLHIRACKDYFGGDSGK